MTELHAMRLSRGVFRVSQGPAASEQWTSDQLRACLVGHGYSEESAEWIMEQAEAAEQIEIHLPGRVN